MRKNDNSSASGQNRLGNALFLGLPVALLLTLFGLLLFSVLLAYTGLSEDMAFLLTRILSPVAVFVGALVLGGRSCTKGWLSGVLLALFYVLTVYLFRSFVYGVFTLDGAFLLTLLWTVPAGVLGGSLGINQFAKKC